MARLKAEEPFLHPDCEISNSNFGRYVEIGRGSRINNVTFGDYSYCDRYADIANTKIGKFANIAAFARIGPTDHPMDRASLHHFHYRTADYWDDATNDPDFFARRRARTASIGHDTWIGHGAVIRPEVSIGHGAVIAAGAVVTKDVPPYMIFAGLPAKALRPRIAPELAERLIDLSWWDWEHDALSAALEDFRNLEIAAFLGKYQG